MKPNENHLHNQHWITIPREGQIWVWKRPLGELFQMLKLLKIHDRGHDLELIMAINRWQSLCSEESYQSELSKKSCKRAIWLGKKLSLSRKDLDEQHSKSFWCNTNNSTPGSHLSLLFVIISPSFHLGWNEIKLTLEQRLHQKIFDISFFFFFFGDNPRRPISETWDWPK